MAFTRRLPRSIAVLILVAVHEELGSSLPIAGADDVVDALHLSTTAYTLAVFGVPLLLATLVEAPLLAFSDRRRHLRPRLASLGLIGVAAGLVVTAVAGHVVALAAAVTVTYVGLGVSTGVAEAMIVDAAPDRSEQVLTRYALWSIVGDIAGPAILGVAAFCGAGFVGAAFVVAAFTVVSAVAVANVDNPDGAGVDDDDEEEEPGVGDMLRSVVSQPWLLIWLFGTALCALLDEALAAFTVLWARDRFAPTWAPQAIVMTFSIGAALGAFVAEQQLAKRDPLRVLFVCAVCCCACFVGFLVVDEFAFVVVSAFFVGATASPLFPIAKAQCHRALPGRPGLVNAAETLFVPVDVVTPVLLALIADRFGVVWALSTLLLQPIALALLAAIGLRRRRYQLPEEPPPEE